MLTPFTHITASKGLILSADISPDTRETIIGDPGRLRQVLINLVGNALKFTKSGEIWVTTKIENVEENAVTLMCQVIDTGQGISEEDRLQLFTEFKQAPSTREGTGLGLSICKRLVALMGGTIGCISALGKGSTFEFTAKFAMRYLERGISREILC